jgi:hypothetical protein
MVESGGTKTLFERAELRIADYLDDDVDVLGRPELGQVRMVD